MLNALLLIALLEPQAWAQGALLGRIERHRPDDTPHIIINEADRLVLDQARYLTPSIDEDRLIGFVGLGLLYTPTAHLTLNGRWDSGALEWVDEAVYSNGRPLGEALRDTALTRILNLEIRPDDLPLSARLGRDLRVLGGGLIFDEYATGAALRGEWAALDVEIGAWIPGRGWDLEAGPLLNAEISYALDDLSGLSLSFIHVNSDAAAKALLDQRLERAILGLKASRAEVVEAGLDACLHRDAALRLWYLSAEADVLLEDHTLSGVVILGGGAGAWSLALDDACPALGGLRWRLPAPSGEIEIRSLAADLRWRVRSSAWLYLTPRLLWLKGDATPNDGRAESFTAPAPLIRDPALFFGGGLGASWGEQGAASSGINGQGVLAPGLSALLIPHDQIEVELLWAHLRVDAPLDAARGDHYGDEVDLKLRWLGGPSDATRLEGEAAVMWLGDFYPAGGPWWRAGLSAQRSWGD